LPETVFQYYRRIRPEQQFRTDDARFDRSLSDLGRSITDLDERIQKMETSPRGSRIGPTGHAARFMQLGNYFSRGSSRR
jgi:hypothetical protein